MENTDLGFTPKNRLKANIIAGAVTILCGLFLLLCGVDVIKIEFKKVILCAILMSVGIVFLMNGIIQNNPVSIWISFAFIVPSIVEMMVKFFGFTYGQLYPFYIGIPAFSCFITAVLTKNPKPHFTTFMFFAVLSFLLFLNSFDVAPFRVIIPIVIVCIGLGILFIAYNLFRKDTEEKLKEE